MKKYYCLIIALLNCLFNTAQTNAAKIMPAAERLETYLPLLKGKAVAVFANQTSMVGKAHLVDTLVKSGVNVVKIYGPEHGFRGNADAGEHVSDAKDKKTGIPVISLYGKHKKLTGEDVKGVDVLLFDIQDIGVRFYTYISSLEYFLEGAAQHQVPVILLDRPNPNGFYIDGPVLDKKFKSFIGMQPIPVVHGMTMGEYAWMLCKEGMMESTALHYLEISADGVKKEATAFDYIRMPEGKTEYGNLNLTIITCKNYNHKSKYVLPVMPSPNLKTMQSIYLYPSTCFFEGTVFSEGRGTDYPFQLFGHPAMPKNLYSFSPKPNLGAKSSKCFYQKCYGWFINGSNEEILKKLNGKIQLGYFLNGYKLFPGKDSFFLKTNFINKLAGNDTFQLQVKQGKTETEIKKSWQPDIIAFKAIRKKYLLYQDFE